MRLRFFTTAARVHLDIFTLCKCNYSFFSSLTLPFFPPTACIIIYCFSLLCRRWVGGKKLFYCFFLLRGTSECQQYPISLSYSGYTFICTVITIPCPPPRTRTQFLSHFQFHLQQKLFLLFSPFATFDLSENFNC
jgi:hypothetical protein